MLVARDELKELMKKKFMAAGMHENHADDMAEVLAWSSERGLHSHGEVRVEYYTERISKGGMTIDPKVTWTQTGPCSGILDADNGCGYPFAIEGMQKAIDMAKENGIGFVGVANVSHTGAIGYYTEMAAKQGMIGLSCTQSDPMVIPYGGAEPFYGTNPIALAAPTADDRIVSFDMATFSPACCSACLRASMSRLCTTTFLRAAVWATSTWRSTLSTSAVPTSSVLTCPRCSTSSTPSSRAWASTRCIGPASVRRCASRPPRTPAVSRSWMTSTITS